MLYVLTRDWAARCALAGDITRSPFAGRAGSPRIMTAMDHPMFLWAKPCDFANDAPPRVTVSALSPPLTHDLPRPPRRAFASQAHASRIWLYVSCGVRGVAKIAAARMGGRPR
jgi:hypothetical protein